MSKNMAQIRTEMTRSVVGDSCYEFYFFEGTDAGWFEYFAPELGHIAFYSISWTPTWYDIREAIIGGKRYKFKY